MKVSVNNSSQLFDLFFDPLYDLDESFVVFTRRIGKIPIIVKAFVNKWATNVASHRDHNVRLGDLVKCFAVLCLFHINAVDFFQKSYGIGVDLRFCFASCGIKFKLICEKVFAERLGDLTAADNALHKLIVFRIFKRRTAYEAFVLNFLAPF